LELVERLLAETRLGGGRWYEAEIHRLKGDILRSQSKPPSEIEANYEAAIALAKRQGARVWELKAADSLNALHKFGATTTVSRDHATSNPA